MVKYINYLFHYVAYYVTWILTIYLASHDYAWLSTLTLLIISFLQLLWQIYLTKETKHLGLFIILLTVAGSFMDTVFLHLQLISFKANPFFPYYSPPWMIGLWFSFAIVFYATAHTLFHRYIVLGLLSFFAFPLAYLIGAKMNAANLNDGYISLFAIGITFCLFFPTVIFIYNKLANNHV